ncbi:MAG: DUF3592 domain-containing protein [Novosphingobium sp.]
MRAELGPAEGYFIYAGLALALFGLAAMIRHDWLRLTRPARRVLAQVLRHESSFQDGGMSFAAVYGFRSEDGELEVTDAVYGPQPSPAVGDMVELAYPDGRPDLARPPRLLTWLGVYATLLFMLGMLIAKLLGWFD